MSKRRSVNSVSRRCPNCRIVLALCFCHLQRKIDTKTKVQFIMHHREKNLTTNTATLAHKILPHSDLLIYGQKDQETKIGLDPKYKYFFLYPSESARPIHEVDFSLYPDITLIVPDGTWRQAKKMHSHNREFASIECLKITETPLSTYFLRKEHRPHFLSTFEATALALKYMEGEKGEAITKLLNGQFGEFVIRNLIARSCYDARKNYSEMREIFISKANYFRDYFKLDPIAFEHFINQS